MHRQPNVCLDCNNVVLPHPNGGRTPKRCQIHTAAHKAERRQQQKRRARERSRPRSCVACGSPVDQHPRGPLRKWCSPACNQWANRNPGAIEAGIYLHAVRRDPCTYCGAPSEQLDHVEPRARGGEDHWSNLTAVCARCNQQKNARPLLRFLLVKPLLEQIEDARSELATLGG